MNSLLSVVRSSLTDLGKAVRGLALMSADLDAVGKALFDGKVPAMWLKKSFPSLKVWGWALPPPANAADLLCVVDLLGDTSAQDRLACLSLLEACTSMQVALSCQSCVWCCGLTPCFCIYFVCSFYAFKCCQQFDK